LFIYAINIDLNRIKTNEINNIQLDYDIIENKINRMNDQRDSLTYKNKLNIEKNKEVREKFDIIMAECNTRREGTDQCKNPDDCHLKDRIDDNKILLSESELLINEIYEEISLFEIKSINIKAEQSRLTAQLAYVPKYFKFLKLIDSTIPIIMIGFNIGNNFMIILAPIFDVLKK